MILYSTPVCPRCRMIKDILEKRDIPFEICMDIKIMKDKGISDVPILEEDDGTMLNHVEAFKKYRP